VVAAESRQVDISGNVLNDHACKIISLGEDTLFFETGAALIGVQKGESWDALSVARASYRESKKRDAQALSTAWGNVALNWFYGKNREDLRTSREAQDGRIVTGGFVEFESDGSPSVQNQTIFYLDDTKQLRRHPDGAPPGPGQITISGVALGLVQEFFDGKTERAVEAFGPIGMVRLIAVDPTTDSTLAKKAIQFAIDNSTGKEKEALGGPIDVAIIHKNRMIEWVSRKKECYEQDQK